MSRHRFQNDAISFFPRLPGGWRDERIHDVLELRTSNVDKKSEEGAKRVRLCNYVDVYKNDKVTMALDFMEATATEAQIERFTLRVGDVVITKDSETPEDIGVPALIAEAAPDLVCGYHLTILRPHANEVVGGYLFYALASRLSSYQFYLAANGVTRYGLTYQGTKNLRIALPAIHEQLQIAVFLDSKTEQIDALIARKTELLEKLKERRIAVITQAVTQGLNPTAPMRDLDFPWLGQVPNHWEVKRGRFAMQINPPSPRLRSLKSEDEVSFVPMDAVGVQGGLSLGQTRVIEDIAGGYTEFQDGDVVVAKITPCFENGKAALASDLTNGAAYGTTELHVLRADNDLDRKFLFYVAVSDTFLKLGESEMYGAGGQKRVPPEFPKNYRMAVPPPQEQKVIADYLDKEMAGLDALVARVQDVVGLLEEYRAALITAATTGKIDVRNVKIPQPAA